VGAVRRATHADNGHSVLVAVDVGLPARSLGTARRRRRSPRLAPGRPAVDVGVRLQGGRRTAAGVPAGARTDGAALPRCRPNADPALTARLPRGDLAGSRRVPRIGGAALLVLGSVSRA